MKKTPLLLLPLVLLQLAATPPGDVDIAIEGSLNEVLIGGGTGMAARSVTFRHRQLIMYPDWAVAGNKRGECRIQVLYKLANLGDAGAGAFTVRHFNNGVQVGEDRIDPLDAHGSRWIHSHGWFSKGRNSYELRLDAGDALAESNEANNLQKFDYQLEGRCKAGHKPVPAGKR